MAVYWQYSTWTGLSVGECCRVPGRIFDVLILYLYKQFKNLKNTVRPWLALINANFTATYKRVVLSYLCEFLNGFTVGNATP